MAAILIPQFTGFQEKARSTQVMVEAKQIATAADSLFVETNAVPVDTDVVQLAGPDIDDAITNDGAVLTLGAATNGHIEFTWEHEVNGVTYTATRVGANGVITVDW